MFAHLTHALHALWGLEFGRRRALGGRCYAGQVLGVCREAQAQVVRTVLHVSLHGTQLAS